MNICTPALCLILSAQVESQPSTNNYVEVVESPSSMPDSNHKEIEAIGDTESARSEKIERSIELNSSNNKEHSMFSLGGGLDIFAKGPSIYEMAMLSSLQGSYPAVLEEWVQGKNPTVTAFMEFNLTDNLSILTKMMVGYSFQTSENAQTSWFIPDYGHEYSAGLSVGNRYCLSRGELVEFSVYYVLHARYLGATNTIISDLNPEGTETRNTQIQTNYVTGGLQAGIILEREILESLYLRLQTRLLYLGAYYSDWKTTFDPTDTQSNASDDEVPKNWGFDTNVEFSPAIEIRYRF